MKKTQTYLRVVDPGEGYRLLAVGESLTRKTEVSLDAGYGVRQWCKLSVPIRGQKIQLDTDGPFPFGYYRIPFKVKD